MKTRIDKLLAAFESAVQEPLVGTLSGQERVWFLVYDPAEQRKIDLRMGDFEMATRRAGKNWVEVSMKRTFPEWMAAHPYRDAYFADPEALVDQLEAEFKDFAIRSILDQIHDRKTDENVLIAIRDVAALFGLARLSDILKGASGAFTGRVLVFFPGEFSQNQYRLLDARDGWSYLARPITA